jgi:hypothetical protein
MANDTPSDGGSIGEFIGDAIRNITGVATLDADTGLIQTWNSIYAGCFYPSGTYYYNQSRIAATSGSGPASGGLMFDASCSVPTALENRPASISSFLCIKY